MEHPVALPGPEHQHSRLGHPVPEPCGRRLSSHSQIRKPGQRPSGASLRVRGGVSPGTLPKPELCSRGPHSLREPRWTLCARPSGAGKAVTGAQRAGGPGCHSRSYPGTCAGPRLWVERLGQPRWAAGPPHHFTVEGVDSWVCIS